jgi:hypothetical protein
MVSSHRLFPDVGGGSVGNKTQNALARITLRWMIRECFKTKSGIMFDANRLHEVGLNPDTLWPVVLPRPPPMPVPENMKVLDMPTSNWFTSLFTRAKPKEKEVEVTCLSEEEEELKDALSPIYDQLKIKWWWWTLEVIVLKHRYLKSNNTLGTAFGFVVFTLRLILKS